jgi:hypothetical protein
LSISAPIIIIALMALYSIIALMALYSSPASGSAAKATNAQIKDEVQAAINHAMEAQKAGEQGRSEALVKHAWMALDKAKKAQAAGPNERLNDGVYSLGEAIEHGQKKQTEDATEHVMRAIMKLSQAAGLQMPEGFKPARDTSEQAEPDRQSKGG